MFRPPWMKLFNKRVICFDYLDFRVSMKRPEFTVDVVMEMGFGANDDYADLINSS